MATEREHELKEAEVQGPTVVKTATVIEKDLSEIKVIRTIGSCADTVAANANGCTPVVHVS